MKRGLHTPAFPIPDAAALGLTKFEYAIIHLLPMYGHLNHSDALYEAQRMAQAIFNLTES